MNLQEIILNGYSITFPTLHLGMGMKSVKTIDKCITAKEFIYMAVAQAEYSVNQ